MGLFHTLRIPPIPTPTRESPLRSAAAAAQSSALRNPASAPLKGRGLPSQAAFTRTTSVFSVSRICTAHARHGSKEWIVRSTSSGFSASATGLPIRQAS